MSTMPYMLCGLRINFEQILIIKCDFFSSILLALDTVWYSYWLKFSYIYWLQKNCSFSAMLFIHDLFSTFFYTCQDGMFKNNCVWMDRIYRNHTITSFYSMKNLKPTTLCVAEESWLKAFLLTLNQRQTLILSKDLLIRVRYSALYLGQMVDQ